MDKNENGSPAQFSPEELIRRLKSQLNINTEQEEDTAEKAPDKTDSPDIPANDAIEENTVADLSDGDLETSESADDDIDEEISSEAPIYEADAAEEEIYADIETVEADAEGTEVATEDNDTVLDEGNADSVSNSDSTVEFSISNLFGTSDTTDDAVKELDAPAIKDDKSSGDDFDFLSFLTASGISAVKPDNDEAAVYSDLETESSELLDAVADDITEFADPIVNSEEEAEAEEILSETDNELSFEVECTVSEDEQVSVIDELSEEEPVVEEDTTVDASVELEITESDVSVQEEDSAEKSVAEIDDSEDGAELDYSFGSESGADIGADEDLVDESKALPDFNMLIALGIPVAEVEKIYGAEAAVEYTRLTDGTNVLDDLSDDEEEYEYTSRSQNEEIEAHHKSEKRLSFIKICAAAVLFILALLFENMPALGAEYTGWMDQSSFPVVHIMADLQLVLFAAVLAWDEIVSGIKALLRRSANVGTVVAAAVLINIICDIGLCFTRVAKYEVKLAGASVIFAILMCLAITAIRLIVETKAFDMISHKGTRSCVLTESADDVRERNAFFDKISKEDASSAKVLSFGKTKFVSGFFRNQTSNRATVIDKILAPAAILCAIVASVIAYAVSKSIGIGLYTLNCASAFLVPVSAFAAGTLTYAKAASYAESMKAAIIGEDAPYDLADSSVVAFEDRDAYPSYCVKLRNLKVYGNIAIVDVLRMTTTAFRQIGGPLSDVLESATSEVNKDIPVDIVKSCEGGVEAVYQGRRLIIGKAEFLHSYGIIPYSDVDDREYLKTGDVSIMYVAYGEELAAKFYIQYTLDVDFEVLLRDLNRAGICVSIRTSDPNIDKRLLQAKLNLNKTSLRIVYREPAEGRSEPTEETASAVIGTGTPSELIHTAMLCDRVVHVYRTNTIVKVLSLVIGFALLVLFALISVNVNVFSGLLIIYQLFWMIPTLVVSKLFL